MTFNVIGTTVEYWSGGDIVFRATIIKRAKPVVKNKDHISEDYNKRDRVYFLAKNTENGKYVILFPRLAYAGNYFKSNSDLKVCWEQDMFSVYTHINYVNEKYVFVKEDEKGFEL